LPRLIGLLLASTLVQAAAPPPRRIVSTAPSITETLYALGLGDRVVGVTDYCRNPPEARSKPRIGTFLDPDFERILATRPDLVLVIKNPVQVAERLRKLGVRAENVNQDLTADIFTSLAQIGRFTGREAEAGRLTARLRAQLDEVRRTAASRRPVKALFLVGRSPGTLQGMVGAGPGTFIDELMRLAGASNMLQGSPIPYPRVSLEQILAADPDFILDMGDFAHQEGRPMEPAERVYALWAKYPRLRAVQRHHVRQIGSDAFVVPGPRVGDAARRMLEALSPEAAR
jgi:iron complex transport system substrate-binding protein